MSGQRLAEFAFFFCTSVCCAGWSSAQETTVPAVANGDKAQPATSNEPQPREQRLASYLTGAKFVGVFTVDRKGLGKVEEETYTIKSCEKLPEADMYRLTARVKYGDTDGEFPMDLKILWSGDTPVITLDNLWIPALGTFSARVLILNGRYAGTWDHGPVGGHLYGRIEKEATAAAPGTPETAPGSDAASATAPATASDAAK